MELRRPNAIAVRDFYAGEGFEFLGVMTRLPRTAISVGDHLIEHG